MAQQLAGAVRASAGAPPGTHHHPTAHSMHHDRAAAELALAEAERVEEAARRTLESRREVVYAAGRIFVGLMFLATAIAKMIRFESSAQALLDSGMQDAHWLLPLAIGVEVAGALSLIAGYKVRRVSIGLVIYLVVVTFVLSFDLANDMNANSALSNLGFAGALLLLAGNGAGRHSVDGAIERRQAMRDAA